jgi:hypothetical protein
MASPKPHTAQGYNAQHTLACERTLITLLRGFGALKGSLRLVGGLVPRYLTPAAPPHIPAHAGTSDVDVVLNLQVLAKDEAYKSLARQLKDSGFARVVNNGKASSWRWQRYVTDHEYVVVEFLRDANDELSGGKVASVEDEGISALAIKHCGIVHDWFLEREVTAQLLDDAGTATETVRFADVPAFIVLKALAFNDRAENKDAADLVHVMRYAGPLQEVAALFLAKQALGTHTEAIESTIKALKLRFCSADTVDGADRDGPVACARFLYGNHADFAQQRMLERRNVSAMVTEFLRLVQVKGNL